MLVIKKKLPYSKKKKSVKLKKMANGTILNNWTYFVSDFLCFQIGGGSAHGSQSLGIAPVGGAMGRDQGMQISPRSACGCSGRVQRRHGSEWRTRESSDQEVCCRAAEAATDRW